MKGESMRSTGNWFRRMGNKILAGLRHFMLGRYGGDKLNMTILAAAAVSGILAAFLVFPWLKISLLFISYALMFWAIFRGLSRNTYKRYQENRKYLQFLQRFKDKDHKYFTCPRCRQPVRVPKGKGKISITCPKCREKFIKKT